MSLREIVDVNKPVEAERDRLQLESITFAVQPTAALDYYVEHLAQGGVPIITRAAHAKRLDFGSGYVVDVSRKIEDPVLFETVQAGGQGYRILADIYRDLRSAGAKINDRLSHLMVLSGPIEVAESTEYGLSVASIPVDIGMFDQAYEAIVAHFTDYAGTHKLEPEHDPFRGGPLSVNLAGGESFDFEPNFNHGLIAVRGGGMGDMYRVKRGAVEYLAVVNGLHVCSR